MKEGHSTSGQLEKSVENFCSVSGSFLIVTDWWVVFYAETRFRVLVFTQIEQAKKRLRKRKFTETLQL